MEPIDVIEAWDLPYHLGNVIKYIARRDIKDGGARALEDIEKAEWYLRRYSALLRLRASKARMRARKQEARLRRTADVQTNAGTK